MIPLDSFVDSGEGVVEVDIVVVMLEDIDVIIGAVRQKELLYFETCSMKQ